MSRGTHRGAHLFVGAAEPIGCLVELEKDLQPTRTRHPNEQAAAAINSVPVAGTHRGFGGLGSGAALELFLHRGGGGGGLQPAGAPRCDARKGSGAVDCQGAALLDRSEIAGGRTFLGLCLGSPS